MTEAAALPGRAKRRAVAWAAGLLGVAAVAGLGMLAYGEYVSTTDASSTRTGASTLIVYPTTRAPMRVPTSRR